MHRKVDITYNQILCHASVPAGVDVSRPTLDVAFALSEGECAAIASALEAHKRVLDVVVEISSV